MKRLFTKEQGQQICIEYFSEGKLSSNTVAIKWNCNSSTIGNVIKRNGYVLRSLSESHKGKFAGKNHPMYGKHHSEKTKQKIREKIGGKNHFNYGKHHSEKTKQKISISNKGNSSWCKGLTKETDVRVKKQANAETGKFVSEKTRQKLSILNKGKPSWCKGLTKETDARVKRRSEKIKGQKRSDEVKQKLREKALLRINLGPYKNTKPELKMKEILNFLNIPFEHQFRLKNHLFDFYILNTNILIEVDGDYWHGNPAKFSKLNKIQQRIKQRDLENETLVRRSSFILLRFWEDDILRNESFVIYKLNEVLNVSNN